MKSTIAVRLIAFFLRTSLFSCIFLTALLLTSIHLKSTTILHVHFFSGLKNMPLYLKRRCLAETNLYYFLRMRSSSCLFLFKCVCLYVAKRQPRPQGTFNWFWGKSALGTRLAKRYSKPLQVYTYPRSLVTHHSTDTVKTSVSLKA